MLRVHAYRRHIENQRRPDNATLSSLAACPSAHARTTKHRAPAFLVAGMLVVVAAIVGARGYQSFAPSSSNDASPIVVLRSEHRSVLGEADGAVSADTTIFDDEIPGVTNLDPALSAALRRAATDAAQHGIQFFVESGWRSPDRIPGTAPPRRGRGIRLGRGSRGWWPQPPRLHTSPETRPTSRTPTPRTGCPNTVPRTGSARPTATNPGTTNCAPPPTVTVARRCTPTRRTIRGCAGDRHARTGPGPSQSTRANRVLRPRAGRHHRLTWLGADGMTVGARLRFCAWPCSNLRHRSATADPQLLGRTAPCCSRS